MWFSTLGTVHLSERFLRYNVSHSEAPICVHWSQGIHKTPRLSFVAKDGLEPSTAGL